MFERSAVINGPLGSEPDIRWLDGSGQARPEWENGIPNGQATSPDDAVYPADLRRADFFRRRGAQDHRRTGPDGFIRGDFDRHAPTSVRVPRHRRRPRTCAGRTAPTRC